MVTKDIKYGEVLGALESDCTVVTASRRLAHEVRLRYAERRSAAEQAWPDPPVLPWLDWLIRIWEESAWRDPGRDELRLLGAGQQRLLWEQVIQAEEKDRALLRVPAAARQAVRAWETAWAWEISWDQVRVLASEDSARFAHWAGIYLEICRQRRWIDHARLPSLLSGIPEDAACGLLPERLLLAGFDELTPQQRSLLARVERCGTEVERWLPRQKVVKAARLEVGEAEAELVAAARWAKSELESDPNCTVGVVVPDLDVRHDMVVRVFEDTLAPGACENLSEPEELLFSVSAGPPLAQHPMVAAALAILDLAHEEPAWQQTSAVLRSPFLGDAFTEADERAVLDLAMRARAGMHWPLARVLDVLEAASREHAAHDCPALRLRLQEALSFRSRWPRRQDSHAWVLCLSRWLESLGWPGERGLDSREYQVQQRWRELMEELAAYEVLLGEVDLAAALRVLNGLCSETTFKPESGRCPILVLGVLEAAGLEFDKLWVCGLHDEAWPPAATPSPFLPYTLQRSLGMPHGSAARELEIARSQLDRLLASAAEVVLSWPAADGDRTLHASPLIEGYASIDAASANEPEGGRDAEIFASRAPLESVSDSRGPGLEGAGTARGGARALELQAVCPFRAFSELRLAAVPVERPVPGIDALERGMIVHDCLHRFWRRVKDHDSLTGMSAGERRSVLAGCLRESMQTLAGDAEPLRGRLLQLETRRLTRLIGELLEVESIRPAFTVEMSEATKRAKAGPLRLGARLDRVDRLQDGSRLVIDYKTGSVSTSDWFGQRPRSPQLPLYATSAGLENVAGIAFVQIRSGNVRFAGLAAPGVGMPAGVKALGSKPDDGGRADEWETLLDDWRRRLARLGAAHHAGFSEVDPLPQACRYCHLQSLCRVDEKRELGEVDANV